jgi:S-adenosylmethionine:tRNA ribosyltransferase-isomerase
MNARPSFSFTVPSGRDAPSPPEFRGLARDEVRLLVSTPSEDRDLRFEDLRDVLRAGDLLVVNESAALPASLPARGSAGAFWVNLSTDYGGGLWVAEPRWDFDRPGPVPIAPGETLEVASVRARWVAPYPGVPRLGFVRFENDPAPAIARWGRPIRYRYVPREIPLAAYQTVFARVPGSAEMPSAGRPFSHRLIADLQGRGVAFAPIVLHAGVSSLEWRDAVAATDLLYPEPFLVPAATVDAIARARRHGGRVVAVGTTVARALESAGGLGECLRAARGFTRLFLSPQRPTRSFDGLLTGFHTADSTHLLLLASFAGVPLVERSYRAALARGYLWHEFGDSQLLWQDDAPRGAN